MPTKPKDEDSTNPDAALTRKATDDLGIPPSAARPAEVEVSEQARQEDDDPTWRAAGGGEASAAEPRNDRDDRDDADEEPPPPGE